MNKNELYMREALKEAEHAFKLNEVPIGCVIVYDDKIIGRGHNLRESSQQSINHAEIIAIQEACKNMNSWRLEECIIYVTIEPCPMCAGAIVQSRIKRVVYGAPDLKAGYAGTIHNTLNDENLNHKVEVISGVLEDDCRTIIKTFFKKLRNC